MYDLLLQQIAQFVQLTEADWQLFQPGIREQTLAKHTYFSREGKRCREIGFILSGSMRHFYTRDGEEKTTYFYFENHFVTDYISCISGKPGLLTIEALTDTRLLVFSYDHLQQCYAASHAWETFGRRIAEYIAAGLEERMTGLLLLSPEERYLQLLQGNKQKILERIPQWHIANYLGITPVSLSRIRKRIHP